MTLKAGSVESAVRTCLDRIGAREEVVGAWAFMDPELVLRQARVLDAGPRRGPLHGMPVGIKDIFDTADMPTEYGSPIYAGHRPRWDAACVSAIRAAGGIVMGKTVTTEFASTYPGKTRNPHNPAHTPGGSSSGSAAAVADRMIPLALGSQTGGSLIRPASYCGVIGYKPSYGFISRHGVKPLAESLDTVGIFARSVKDVVLLAEAITRRPLSWPVQVGAPRLGVWRTHNWREAAAESVAAIDEASRLAARAGAAVRIADMPEALAALDDTHHAIERFEMADTLAHEMQSDGARLSAALRERIEAGRHVSGEAYEQAQLSAQASRALMRGVFSQFDMLLTPSVAGEAPAGLDGTGNAIFNRGWTLLHLPCVTLPGFSGPKGLPVGVQLVGPFGEDARLLAHAAWLEKTLAERTAA